MTAFPPRTGAFLQLGRFSPRAQRALARTLTAACLVLGCILAAPGHMAQAQTHAQGTAQPQAPLEALEIATKGGVVVLEVEVARSEAQRSTGLMYRKELPERQGMLFDFHTDQPVAMWMKNTFIPLDMLFIRANGTIARIETMTTPFSERTIASGEPVRAVLELAGGATRRLGIAPGDRVSTNLLGK